MLKWTSSKIKSHCQTVFFVVEFYTLMAPNTAQNHAKNVRPPVVVVLGHVDHGKTTLLDTIRKTSIAAKETGSITQHIGAYQAEIKGKKITFLDTPGHEAFSAIRSRGAHVADIAILVIAADESLKPQTQEAIRIIKQEELPFVVAINKIDREGANPQKVRQDLSAEDVVVEDWGGKVPVVEISARDGRNIDALLEMILLVAELEELTQDTVSPAQGIVIESYLDKRRGYAATLIVQKGVLEIGQWVVVGKTIGKIKSMEDFLGKNIERAFPSQPALVVGWSNPVDVGRPFAVAASKETAQAMAIANINIKPLLLFMTQPLAMTETDKRTLDIVFKSDVASSMEAIDSVLKSTVSDKVTYHVLDYGVGNITEGDVKTAISSHACIFGFRVGVESSAKKLAEREHIKVFASDTIYELVEGVRRELTELLDPQINRTVIAKLRVLALFKKEGKYQILGGRVMSGKVTRGALVDLVQGNTLIKLGKITQLQQNKEDVTEVREGLEAGLRIDISASNAEVKEGDILEIYEEEKVQATL